ncbi:chromosome segregation protein SMC [Lacrimispora sp. NSJ-141]|uniref:Chromosome partition protein Smc n=1 Tax=Lientehia hominis TaxID=2897778 RepID=A0AAP2RIJ0_9FIRM|nr:chromosome segregation protein SMC [Lientehia hominis]MCD2492682.1 chromosome segregation protein SMC [Lientehia hominis]
MFLKSIEVQGFKSFANKILFEFNDGITGIVGPNGSGKSNVADAVRWVLGEQSAKQLRGASMQDVIFSGTQNRKPQGYAYVAITLDNSDHSLPIDYDEVTVSRRVYRSGESEYLLNGAACRLRDINEMFYDTGIGKEGYSIIGQGQIDKILSGKPEDRRELFDEAAGIVKFKKRKNIAQKKLLDEQQNLVRVTDILTELEKQVGPLEEQSGKAKEYLRLKEELKNLDMHSFFLESQAQKEKKKSIEDNLTAVSADLNESRRRSEELKGRYDELAETISQVDEKLEYSRTELGNSHLALESMEGRIKVLEEQIHTEEASEEHVKARMSAISRELSDKIEQKTGFTRQKGEINEILDALDDRQGLLREKIEEDEDRIHALEFEISTKKNDILGTLNDKASLGAKNQRFVTLLEQNQVRKSELSQRLLRVKSEEEAQKQVIDRIKVQIKVTNEEIDGLSRENEEKNLAYKDAQENYYRENKILNQKQQEYHTLRTRLESLRNLAERYEGYGNSIRKVMEAKTSTPGIIGVVADLLETPKEYETAIETALGGSIQNVVTDSESTAKNLIQYLKKNKFGRATFLPLTSITARGGFQKKEALGEPGVIGLAHDLVSVKGGYNKLAEYLLGRILVVDNIDHAIALAKKFKYSLRIVTLEGELLNAGGSMTGGAFRNSSNLLGRKRELEELERSMNQVLSQYDKVQERVTAVSKEMKNLQEAIETNRDALQKAQVSLSSLEANLSGAGKKAEEIAAGYESIAAEGRQLAAQFAEIEAEKAELKAESKDLESKNKEYEREIKKLETKAEKEREKREAHRAEYSKAQLEFSSMSQKDSFILENILRITGEAGRLKEEEASLRESMECCRKNVEEKRAQIVSIRSQIDEKAEESVRLETSISEYTAEKERYAKEQRSFFEKREALSNEISRLDKEVYRLESQKEKCEESIEQQIQYLWEEYELTPSAVSAMSFEEELSLTAIRRQVAALRQAIKELGPVNVNAIEDYKEISERYFFMKGQHDDLKKAEESLVQIIEELDSGMRRQFEEKFRDIRLEFDRVFRELFGGGQGTLELVEGEDLLEAGIQIIAQPPGKKLQNMMQLSGGEKALTAISLLFAIQNLKPSPFCLLDEIEAALDDSNVGRYAAYLEKLKKHTQFIVITHRRGTMLIADRLYGITMQEKGVSTLVSVDLTEQPA